MLKRGNRITFNTKTIDIMYSGEQKVIGKAEICNKS